MTSGRRLGEPLELYIDGAGSQVVAYPTYLLEHSLVLEWAFTG